jgi:hypothetical protein
VTAVCAGAVLPAFAETRAQTTRTLTITEEQISNSFRVTNPPRRSVSDVYLDLQPGQVVVSAKLRIRGRDALSVEATYVPRIENGRVYWSVASASVNGHLASQELLNQINASISSSWRVYFRKQLPAGRITGIEITEDDLTITYTGR